MEIVKTDLKDAYFIANDKFEDERGFFMESFNLKKFKKNIKIRSFVQDNHSKSSRNVLRGLHYQIKHPQGKLVRCISGTIYDVIVDLRESSPSFGKWFGIVLDDSRNQLWVPPGFAHGFCTATDFAEVEYKVTDYYYPKYDRTLIWNDPTINIEWPSLNPILSEKDMKGKTFEECEKYV